jgi:predicted anti-sigma-YlaC factor YlaD
LTAYETTTARLVQQELGACALIQDLLPLYVEGEVSPGSRDLIVEHVARCDRCAGYLAGTQNALTLLRRDRTIHVATLERDTPNRQTVSARQRLVTAIAVLTTYGAGLIASVALAHLVLEGPDPMAFFVGLVLGLASLASLLALARGRSPLTLQRVIALLGSCTAATFGSFIMFESGGEPLPVLIVWALGLVGVWVAVGPGVRDREPAP